MVRPKSQQPTPGELEVLQILWDRGDSTVREVSDILNQRKKRAYTSVMSLLNVMNDKGFVSRKPLGRAFIYRAKLAKEKTLGSMLRDLVGRAFDGSAATLVTHLLDQAQPTSDELESIRKALDQYEQQSPDEHSPDEQEAE